MKIIGAQVFEPTGGFVHKTLYTAGTLLCSTDRGGETLDATGCYAIPGLTDLHFHGCRGYDFSDGDGAGLGEIARYELRRGVTQICPAGMTLSAEQLLAICRTAGAYRRQSQGGATLCGIHLEGPFLSAEKKGAQNADWLQPPSLPLLEQLMEASGGLVKLVTIAPELPGALEFIRGAGSRVTVSLGHTAADYETAAAAFSAGARQVTHLFNAMSPFSHRAPGVVGAAFDCPECRVELICDGVHVHPSVVRATFALFGARRVILISDTMRAAGMGDGDYTLGGQAVKVTGNRAVLSSGTLAGSVTDLMGCLRTAVGMGISLHDAVLAAAVNPAQAIGIYSRVGSLDPGKQANVVLLDEALHIRAILFQGALLPPAQGT